MGVGVSPLDGNRLFSTDVYPTVSAVLESASFYLRKNYVWKQIDILGVEVSMNQVLSFHKPYFTPICLPWSGARFTSHLKPKIFVSSIQILWKIRKS